MPGLAPQRIHAQPWHEALAIARAMPSAVDLENGYIGQGPFGTFSRDRRRNVVDGLGDRSGRRVQAQHDRNLQTQAMQGIHISRE